MKRIYALFLLLYPREYRDLFGPEVLDVFAQAAREQRARRWTAWVRFLVTELSGAIVSAAAHWLDRFSRPDAVAVPGGSRSFGVLGEAQDRIETNLKRMTDAIAHHDFEDAGACYFEDLKARDDLRQLRDRYGFEDD